MLTKEELLKAQINRWALSLAKYREFKKMMYCTNVTIPLDTCCVQESPKCETKKALPRKGNENMYVEQNMTVKEKTTEDVRREHFLDELTRVYHAKEEELREKFGLKFTSPRSPQELVEWIKSGDFTFSKDYDPIEDEWCTYENPVHGIRWTKVKEDRKGYDAAKKALIVERTKFQNEIWAEVDPANFIKILDKFEKSKLH